MTDRARSRQDANREHDELVARILAKAGQDPTVRLFHNRTSKVRALGSGQMVDRGLIRGGTDIVGVVGPRGIWLGIEVKTGRATTTPEQRAHAEYMRACGAVVGVARSLEDADRLIQEARS